MMVRTMKYMQKKVKKGEHGRALPLHAMYLTGS